jgi:hypothetical protein
LFWISSKSASDLIESKPRKNMLLPNKRRSTLLMTANFIQGRHTTRGGNQSSMCPLPNHCCDKISRMRCIYTTRHRKSFNCPGWNYKPFKPTRIFQDCILQEIRLKNSYTTFSLNFQSKLPLPNQRPAPNRRRPGKERNRLLQDY